MKASDVGVPFLGSSLTMCMNVERIEDEYAKREGGA